MLKTAKAQRAAVVDPAAIPAADRKVAAAQMNVNLAQRRLGEADGDLRTVTSQAENAVHVFQDEARRCAEEMDHASRLGIRNDVWSFLDRRSDVPALGLFIEPFASLAALIKDPGALVAWREALSGIGDVLTVAAIILLAVGTGGVALAVVLGAAPVVSVAVMAVDAARVARRELRWEQLIFDGAEVALSGAGMKATAKGGIKAVELARGAGSATWTKRYLKYGTSGRRLPVAKRAEEIATQLRDLTIGKVEDIVPDQPAPGGALCRVAGGPAASPLALIRHTRPLRIRSEALAEAAP